MFSEECSCGRQGTCHQFSEQAPKHTAFRAHGFPSNAALQGTSHSQSGKSRQDLGPDCKTRKVGGHGVQGHQSPSPLDQVYKPWLQTQLQGPGQRPGKGTPARSPVSGGTARTPCQLYTSQRATGKKNRPSEPVCPGQVITAPSSLPILSHLPALLGWFVGSSGKGTVTALVPQGWLLLPLGTPRC